MAYHLAKIEVLIWADNETEAADALVEGMRGILQEFEPASSIIDWRYSEAGPVPDSGTGFEYSAMNA